MEKRGYKIFTVIFDLVIVTISFIIILWFKPTNLEAYLPTHIPFFILLSIVWIIVSIINGKMIRGKITNLNSLFFRILSSNLISISLIALTMFVFRRYEYSRTIVLGTALLSTVLELLCGIFFLSYKFAVLQGDISAEHTKDPSENDLVNGLNGNGNHADEKVKINPSILDAISNECGSEMMQEVIKIAGSNLTDRTVVLSTPTAFNITSLGNDQYHYIINLCRINDIKKPNDLMDAVNRKLELNGYFFCCVETKDQRKKRLLKKFLPVLNYIYYTLDFIIKRVLPKISFTKKLYYFLTRGENNVFSRAEVLGRLCRAGFIISQESFIGNMLCIEAKKICDPFPKNDNLYGLLIALPRVGKHGQMIKVYKMRTMHPYSEYIQDYVYNLNQLREGGKFKYDFRITSWGAVCRKIWLDEIPMFINLVRGDMKLVGVRPLSRQYFELYNKNVRDRRIKYKPGLIPPYYADLPDNINGIQASEMKYLDSFDKHPVITDFSYFWKSVWNILFRHARSK